MPTKLERHLEIRHSGPAPEGSGHLGDAPCQFDRWCADPMMSTSFFGARHAWKFQQWMDRHSPCQLPKKSPKLRKVASILPSAAHPVQLSLDATIPVESCSVSPGATVDLGGTAWKAILEEEVAEFGPLPDGLHLHPATADAFFRSTPMIDAVSTELYIDGSANDQHAGWSAVMIQYDRTGAFKFQGCCCGPVLLNQDSEHWMGAVSINNIAAELQAMIVAQSLVLKKKWNHQVTTRPDLQFSHHLAVMRVGAKNAILWHQWWLPWVV